MKKSLSTLIVILTIGIVNAQEIKSLDASPLDFAVFRPDGQGTNPVARIIYSRPQKKERVVFGELVPYGKIWRTGANQSTEFNVYRDISFNGKTLNKGSYTLYTIPEKEEWTIIFNSNLFTWGAYDYDISKDVLRIEVPVKESEKNYEAFGIAFKGVDGNGTLLIAWDNIEVYVEFEY